MVIAVFLSLLGGVGLKTAYDGALSAHPNRLLPTEPSLRNVGANIASAIDSYMRLPRIPSSNAGNQTPTVPRGGRNNLTLAQQQNKPVPDNKEAQPAAVHEAAAEPATASSKEYNQPNPISPNQNGRASDGSHAVIGHVATEALPATGADGWPPSSPGNLALNSGLETRNVSPATKPAAASQQQLELPDTKDLIIAVPGPVPGARRSHGRPGRTGLKPVAKAASNKPTASRPKPVTNAIRDGRSRSGSNAVGKAMTAALVKESAKVRPAHRPPKPQSPSQSGRQ